MYFLQGNNNMKPIGHFLMDYFLHSDVPWLIL